MPNDQAVKARWLVGVKAGTLGRMLLPHQYQPQPLKQRVTKMKRQRSFWLKVSLIAGAIGFLFWSVSGMKIVIELPKTQAPAVAKVDDPQYDPLWHLKAQNQFDRTEIQKLRNTLYALMADLDTQVMNANKNQIPAYNIISIIKFYDTSPNKVFSTTIERRYLANRR